MSCWREGRQGFVKAYRSSHVDVCACVCMCLCDVDELDDADDVNVYFRLASE